MPLKFKLKSLSVGCIFIICFISGCQTSGGINSIGVRDTVSGNSTNNWLPANINKIAVFTLKKEHADHLETYFMESLFKKGYEIASRADLPIVSKEISFQQSGNTGRDCCGIRENSKNRCRSFG